MAQRSDQVYKKMMGTMKNLDAFAPVNYNDINAEVVNKMGGFQPLYDDLANTEAQAYSTPTEMFKAYQDAYGGEPSVGVGALDQLNSILRETGRNFGTADKVRGVIDTYRGRAADVAGGVYDQYNQERQGLANKYDQLLNTYNSLKSAEDSAAARAMAGGGGSNIADIIKNFLKPGKKPGAEDEFIMGEDGKLYKLSDLDKTWGNIKTGVSNLGKTITQRTGLNPDQLFNIGKSVVGGLFTGSDGNNWDPYSIQNLKNKKQTYANTAANLKGVLW